MVSVAFATGCQLVFSTSSQPAPDAEPQLDAAADAEPQLDAAPRTIERLVEANFAHGLHLTPSFVYFSESLFTATDNRVGRVDRISGDATFFSTQEGAAPNIHTLDDDTIYWTTWEPQLIRARVVSSGQTTTVATATDPTFALAPLPRNGTLLAFSGKGEVYELPSTNPPTMLPPARSLGAFGTLTSATVLEDTLLWTDQSRSAMGGVYTAPVDGASPPVQLVVDDDNAWGLVANDEYIVYGRRGIDGGTGLAELIRVPRAGGTQVTLAMQRTEIRGLALDTNGDVYFAEFVPRGSIWKVPIDGSAAPVRVVDDQSSPLYVAVTDREIYWTNYAPGSDGGGVFRVTK